MFSIISYSNFLQNSVSIIEIFIYTISVIIILLSVLYSIFILGKEINDYEKAFEDTRLILGESISLALTFILSVEILKIFYIKTYKQLVIIASLTLLKLVINYYLLNEIEKDKDQKPKSQKPK
jgi:uncharacterized membrane protein